MAAAYIYFIKNKIINFLSYVLSNQENLEH